MPSLKITDLFSAAVRGGVLAASPLASAAAAVEPFRLRTPTGTRTLGSGWTALAPATWSATGILKKKKEKTQANNANDKNYKQITGSADNKHLLWYR
jgi:hypothetical protein